MPSFDDNKYQLGQLHKVLVKDYRCLSPDAATATLNETLNHIEVVRSYEGLRSGSIALLREMISSQITQMQDHYARNKKMFVFYGNSGIGKSALLNAILGRRILPSTSRRARACTQFPCIVQHHPSSTPEIRFTMYTNIEWMTVVEDILCAATEGTEEQPQLNFNQEDLHALMSFYNLSVESTKEDIIDCVRQTDILQISPMSDFDTFHNILSHPAVMFVKECEIYVELPHWTDGEIFVDLPGVDDTSRLRTACANMYRDEARVLFLVSDIRRALSDANLRRQFTSADQFRIARNTQNSITAIVCSRSDSDLDDVENVMQSLLERNQIVRDNIARVLNCPGIEETTFCVSAKYYLHHQDIQPLRNPDSQLSEDLDWTEVPRLIQYISRTSDDITRSIVDSFVTRLKLITSYCVEATVRLNDEMIAIRRECLNQLREDINTTISQIRQMTADGISTLQTTLAEATRIAHYPHTFTRGHYSRYNMRWNTYRCQMSRNGVFRHNMNMDLASFWMERTQLETDALSDKICSSLMNVGRLDMDANLGPTVKYRLEGSLSLTIRKTIERLAFIKQRSLDYATRAASQRLLTFYSDASNERDAGCLTRMHGTMTTALRRGQAEKQYVLDWSAAVTGVITQFEIEILQTLNLELQML